MIVQCGREINTEKLKQIRESIIGKLSDIGPVPLASHALGNVARELRERERQSIQVA